MAVASASLAEDEAAYPAYPWEAMLADSDVKLRPYGKAESGPGARWAP